MYYYHSDSFSYNQAWGLATLLSIRENIDSQDGLEEEYLEESESVVRVFRWVAKSLQEHADEFKTQECEYALLRRKPLKQQTY